MQKDLFGNSYTEPMKGKQLPMFHEPASIERPDTDTPTDKRIRRKFAKTPTAPMFPPAEQRIYVSPTQLPRIEKPEDIGSIRQRVEAELKRRRLPFVNVTEATRKLFQPHTIDLRHCFHFVVYQDDGDDWLLFCGEAGEERKADMRQWQQIFGDGFKAVFAVDRAAGIAYRNLEGEKLELHSNPKEPNEAR